MTSFLDHYLHYAAVNESPRVYHQWCGLSLLSHLVGKRIWTDERMFIVYPNMYVNLVGPPGLAKTTATNVAKSFIEENYPEIFVAPASITKESIVQTMARPDGGCKVPFEYKGEMKYFSQISIIANEMVSLLSAGGNIIGMVDFLTDIWDRKEYREKTKNKGDHTIKNPFVNILGCFTTDTVKALMHSKIITGGMSRRCIFAYHDGHGLSPVPRIIYTPAQIESKQIAQFMATKIVKLTGPFSWTPEADEFYLDWYNSNFKRIEGHPSATTKNFLRSKSEYCMKISMLLAIAEPNPTLVHTLNSFKSAVDIVTAVEDGASILFDGQGRNELTQLALDVEAFVRARAPKVYKNQIVAQFWKECKDGDITELDRVIEQLMRLGKVKKIDSFGTNTGQSEILWIHQQ